MSDIKNPWDNGGGNQTQAGPWGENVSGSKVVNINTVKTGEKAQIPEFNPWWVVVVIVFIWLLSGIYQVQPNEQGVVLRFGKYVDTTDAGLHYHLPYPIETVKKVSTTQERSINLGEAAAYTASNTAALRNTPDNNLRSFTESHMLTGDENIVDINLTVVWKIKSAKDYLFNVRSPDETVRVAAQSVLREIVGQSEMQSIITGDRGKVEDDTKSELQSLLDSFGSGVEIVRVKLQKADPPKQVVDAFNEVQRAKADLERFKNEAEAYRNEILPKARGEASKILQDAEAYKSAVVNQAKGDTERFLSVYNAYRAGKDVTAKRLYLETIENVLSNSNKVILDPSAKGGNVLPYLPLDRLGNRMPQNNNAKEGK